jgi:hypothetical protein
MNSVFEGHAEGRGYVVESRQSPGRAVFENEQQAVNLWRRGFAKPDKSFCANPY